MGAPYSQDLRERVISVVDGGMGAYQAAPLLRVSVSYIYKALGRRRETGETTARPSGRIEPGASSLRRRERRVHQNDPALRPLCTRQKARLHSPARPLENNDLRWRPASGRHDRAVRL